MPPNTPPRKQQPRKKKGEAKKLKIGTARAWVWVLNEEIAQTKSGASLWIFKRKPRGLTCLAVTIAPGHIGKDFRIVPIKKR